MLYGKRQNQLLLSTTFTLVLTTVYICLFVRVLSIIAEKVQLFFFIQKICIITGN